MSIAADTTAALTRAAIHDHRPPVRTRTDNNGVAPGQRNGALTAAGAAAAIAAANERTRRAEAATAALRTHYDAAVDEADTVRALFAAYARMVEENVPAGWKPRSTGEFARRALREGAKLAARKAPAEQS